MLEVQRPDFCLTMQVIMTDLAELNMRLAICRGVIRELEGIDDPRQPSALEYYKAQEKELEKRISECKPPDVVVGLKSAVLFGKAEE